MKLFKRSIVILLSVAFIYALTWIWRAVPSISGYGAKNLCTCAFAEGRKAEEIIANELGNMPVSAGTFKLNINDSSAEGNVFGLAKRKAIYRKGLGCTLISGLTESELRAQIIQTPTFRKRVLDTIAWPMGEKVSGVIPSSINFEKLNQTIENAFTEADDKKQRRLRAIVVVYDGQIIAERYASGYDKNSRHQGWSMTKSVVNALVGILVRDHKLNVDDPAPVGQWANTSRARITLNDLMHFSSGLKWSEDYSNPSPMTNMLLKEKDMGSYAASLPQAEEPGKKFLYSSGSANIVSLIVREKVGNSGYYNFPYDSLFRQIGMYSALLEPDASGTFVGSSYCLATARDWARFGLLYLNDGVWNGKRILPEGWVHYTTTPAKSAPEGEYGALFWLNAGALDHPEHRELPSAPTDTFMAEGHYGQNVWIVPSKKLVIARLSQTNGNPLDENRFLAEIISALP